MIIFEFKKYKHKINLRAYMTLLVKFMISLRIGLGFFFKCLAQNSCIQMSSK